jgi:hypothetical protein
MKNNTMKTLVSLGSALLAGKAAQAATSFEREDVLGWMGLTRRHSHFWENLALVGVGAVVGATGALLFAPAAGSETRRRIGDQMTRLREEAGERIGQAREQLAGAKEQLLEVVNEQISSNGPSQREVPADRRS